MTSLMFIAAPFDDGDPIAPIVQDGADHVLVLAPWAVKIIVGVLLPFVVALIVKARASDFVQGAVGIVVAAVAAVIARATLVDGSAVFDRALLVDGFHVYAPQLLSYLGLWKHLGLNGRLAPGFGIGAPVDQHRRVGD